VNSATDAESRTAQARVLSGSMVLLTGSGLATAFNFIYNLAVAQFLGAAAFGHAIAVYTLLVLVSAVTLSFQVVSAKVVAQQDTLEHKSSAYRGFHRQAWMCGAMTGLFLFVLRNVIANYLHLPSPFLVVLLAVGAVFYVPLGSRRGYLQGTCGFRALAINLVLEGFIRLAGSLLLIELGYGVTGVIAANAAAVAIAYLFAFFRQPAMPSSEVPVPVSFREGLQAIVFFVGQVLINNCDIVVVKHFFPPAPAGLYAAVALVGRVVYSSSWAVISTMFPVAAAASRKQEPRRHGVLGTSMLLVLGIGSVLTLGLRLAPAGLWTMLFGSRFGITQGHNLPFLLALYAATTTVYSLSVVVIAYEMSHKIANTGWVQLAFTAVLVGGMYRYHSSLEQVILVQLVMMVLLLIFVALPFLLTLGGFQAVDSQGLPAEGPIRMLRRVSENEVISEFLKTDFYNPKFKDYHGRLNDIVTSPNLNLEDENQLRRALLFIKHGSLWRELPHDTEWFEVEVATADLPKIHAFPRAQWRKLARGHYAITRIAELVRAGVRDEIVDDDFLVKIHHIRTSMNTDTIGGAVLLIGRNDSGPFTILDGNHRLLAAMLVSSQPLHKFHFFCGISPNMDDCCWFETNVSTLMRYAANLVRYLVYNPKAELARLLQNS
jgi:O-antigen/teichoic acid export membrane protein